MHVEWTVQWRLKESPTSLRSAHPLQKPAPSFSLIGAWSTRRVLHTGQSSTSTLLSTPGHNVVAFMASSGSAILQYVYFRSSALRHLSPKFPKLAEANLR